MKSKSVTIQMKAIEQYFPVVLFFLMHNVFLTFKSMDEILQCDHFKWKLFSSAFLHYHLISIILRNQTIFLRISILAFIGSDMQAYL